MGPWSRLQTPGPSDEPEVAIRALVTGAAGFIGSHLTEALLSRGDEVVAVDSFTDAYAPEVKRRNAAELEAAEGCSLHRTDLRDADLTPLVAEVDVVLHLAAVPGVRASWSDQFRHYVEGNVLATQRLLEAAKDAEVDRFVYASSSSVYGDLERYPVDEEDAKRPRSPYGVTKLAAEHLCDTYVDVFGLETVSLRYFSVYGPRQRPDMGVHRMIEAALGRGEFTIFGDGSQVRDMTYVDDVVAATIAAADADVPPGSVVNIAGGSEVSVKELIDLVSELVGSDVDPTIADAQPGDVLRTGATTTRARDLLGWRPTVDLRTGLRRQIEWHRSLR